MFSGDAAMDAQFYVIKNFAKVFSCHLLLIRARANCGELEPKTQQIEYRFNYSRTIIGFQSRDVAVVCQDKEKDDEWPESKMP